MPAAEELHSVKTVVRVGRGPADCRDPRRAEDHRFGELESEDRAVEAAPAIRAETAVERLRVFGQIGCPVELRADDLLLVGHQRLPRRAGRRRHRPRDGRALEGIDVGDRVGVGDAANGGGVGVFVCGERQVGERGVAGLAGLGTEDADAGRGHARRVGPLKLRLPERGHVRRGGQIGRRRLRDRFQCRADHAQTRVRPAVAEDEGVAPVGGHLEVAAFERAACAVKRLHCRRGDRLFKRDGLVCGVEGVDGDEAVLVLRDEVEAVRRVGQLHVHDLAGDRRCGHHRRGAGREVEDAECAAGAVALAEDGDFVSADRVDGEVADGADAGDGIGANDAQRSGIPVNGELVNLVLLAVRAAVGVEIAAVGACVEAAVHEEVECVSFGIERREDVLAVVGAVHHRDGIARSRAIRPEDKVRGRRRALPAEALVLPWGVGVLAVDPPRFRVRLAAQEFAVAVHESLQVERHDGKRAAVGGHRREKRCPRAVAGEEVRARARGPRRRAGIGNRLHVGEVPPHLRASGKVGGALGRGKLVAVRRYRRDTVDVGVAALGCRIGVGAARRGRRDRSPCAAVRLAIDLVGGRVRPGGPGKRDLVVDDFRREARRGAEEIRGEIAVGFEFAEHGILAAAAPKEPVPGRVGKRIVNGVGRPCAGSESICGRRGGRVADIDPVRTRIAKPVQGLVH